MRPNFQLIALKICDICLFGNEVFEMHQVQIGCVSLVNEISYCTIIKWIDAQNMCIPTRIIEPHISVEITKVQLCLHILISKKKAHVYLLCPRQVNI